MQSISYDPTQYSLTIDFKSGHQVIHKFVYPMVFQQFKEAPSKGSYYSRQIKSKYPTVSMRTPLKVSDFNKAKKEFRYAAKSHK